jgi:hypothetical protein
MLVYANSFRINLPQSDLSSFWKAVDAWMIKKTKGRLRPSRMVNEPSLTTPDGHQLEVVATDGFGAPKQTILAMAYGHPDSTVHGRFWTTRVGLRTDWEHACADVTIVTETTDVSVQSGLAPVMTSRPGVVLDLINHCGLIDDMLVADVQELKLSELAHFKGEMEAPSRRYAIVLISPDPFSEDPEVDPIAVLNQVVGLANVFYIPNKREAKIIADTLGHRLGAWSGSVNILYPPQKNGHIPSTILLQKHLINLRMEQVDLARHFLHLITHRLNLMHYREEVSPEDVRRLALDREIEELEAKGIILEQVEIQKLGLEEQLEAHANTINQKNEIIEKLRQSINAKDVEIEKERKKAERAEGHWIESEEELEKLRPQVEALTLALETRKKSNPGETEVEQVPLQSVLDAVQRADELYSGILDFSLNSKSEHKNSSFENPEEVFKALEWLATRYAPSKSTGGLGDPDQDLRKWLSGWRFSGHQSQATMSASKEWYLCPRRDHRGGHIWLEEHIKSGNSRKAEETIRIAFAWDDDRRVLIIGYIGQHQENTKS